MVINKAVILAGGNGTRMGMVSRIYNKHINIVYKYPMILYPILNARECGITDIMIVTNVSSDVQRLVGDGHDFGVDVSYRVQSTPNGIADALKLTEKFVNGEPFICLLGDNFYNPFPIDSIRNWDGNGAKVFAMETKTPELYGVLEFGNVKKYMVNSDNINYKVYGMDNNDATIYSTIPEFLAKHKIRSIIEKPEHWIGNLFVLGMYLYDQTVWAHIKHIHMSDRGELEITDVNDRYICHGALEVEIFNGKFLDCGNPDGLLDSANFVRECGDYYDRLIYKQDNS